MLQKLILPVFALMLLLFVTGCDHNKIACPTYAESFPDAKKKTVKPGEQKPEMPKATKARSGVLPPGYK